MFQLLKRLLNSNTHSSSLQEAIQQGALLIDVRTPAEFLSGNVAGSVNIPLSTLKSKASSLRKHACVIVFCQSGMRSQQAKTILEDTGISSVLNGETWYRVNGLKIAGAAKVSTATKEN